MLNTLNCHLQKFKDFSAFLRSFVSEVNYAAHVGITFDNFYDGYVFIRLVFSLIGGVLAVIAAITAALSIKSVVKTGVAVVKGVTVAFTIVATLGVPVLINLLYNLISSFDAVLNSTPTLASSPISYANILITALSSLSLLLPIIALLRAGGDIPQEALNAVEEAPKKVEAPKAEAKKAPAKKAAAKKTTAKAAAKKAPAKKGGKNGKVGIKVGVRLRIVLRRITHKD